MKADLHIHSYYSQDGLSSPKEIIAIALQRGIQCLAITDHQEIKGAIEALKISFDKNILIIPGLEIKSQEGDILGLGIKNKIPKGLSAIETIRAIKKLGGLAVLPHPFSLTNPFKFKKINNLEELINLIDAIEVLNAINFHFANQKALFFSQKYSLPFTAGSDAHHCSFVGQCYLELKEVNSEKEIFEEIKKKKVTLGGKELNFSRRIEGYSQRIAKKIKNLFYARRK